MHLKKIEIKGFKSFPDRTEILFPKGLISVVGPNGSGKSNILDAIRWVLGEQSMKSLRGEKLEDVIFSGTENRKGMTHCEVSLLLDNADRSLNVDYLEVEIRRKAFQSGESQFFINGRQCRLKDIRELLLDTGIGREGYSIISQGKIDELVNGSSLHRRRVIEEAAGITKYRYRKEESQKKLDHTRENLERICDVYFEIERQVRPLEQQKKKAETYLALREELRLSDVNRLLGEKETVEREREGIREKLRTIEEEMERKLSEREENLLSAEKLRQELQSLRDRIAQIEEKRQAVSAQIADLEREEAVLLERKEHTVRNLGRIRKLQAESEEVLQKQQEEQVEQETEWKNLLQRCEKARREHREKLSVYEEEKKRLENIEKSIESNRATIVEWMNRQAALESRIELLRISALQRQQSLEAAEEELRVSEQSAEEILSRLSFLVEKIRQTRESLSQCEKQMERKRQELEESGQRLREEEEALRLAEREEKDCSVRKNLLLKMEEEMEGIARGSRELLRNSGLPGIVDVVASALRVKTGYEKAIEAALGGSLQHLIISEAQSAKACITYLKEKKLGRVTFLPLDTVRGSTLDYKDKGIPAIFAVEYDPSLQSVMEYLLGRIVIVDTMDEAMEMSKKYQHRFKIATKEGEIFNAGGSITGGTLFHSTGILQRRRSIEECRERMEKLSEKMGKIQEKILREQLSRQRVESELENLLQERESRRRSLQEEEAQRAQGEVEENYRIEMKSKLQKQAEGLQRQKQEEAKTLLDCEEEIREYRQKLNSIKKETEDLLAKRESESRAAEAKEEEIRVCEIEKTRLEEQVLSAENAKRTSEKILAKSREEKENLALEESENLSLLREIEEELQRFEGEIALSKEGQAEAEGEQQKFQSLREPLEQSLQELEEAGQKSERETAELNTKKVRAEAEEGRYDYRLQAISDKIREEYQLEIEEAEKLRSEEADTSGRHISMLKSRIAEIGNVNLDAIEEFEKIHQRYLLYREQKIDLEDSVDKIDRLIRTLEKNMVSEFAKSFREINEKFGEVFRILFGGGRGELILTDESNWLESSIEINVQPPGKKLKSISVLSGGEKALSAIGILFAILKRKPAPFCVLDEIDAPLDDVNIHRFVSLLGELTTDTQFLTITHRRGTMESSDYIYGVTMEENGISKIVSLQLEEAANYIEQ